MGAGRRTLCQPLSGGRSQCRHIDFNEQIKPILSDRCFLCHGPDAENRQAELRLDLRDQAMRESTGEASHIITPGDPSQSELYLRISIDATRRCACLRPIPSCRCPPRKTN